MTNFNIEDQLIMNLLSEMNSVRVSMVYKRKIIQKIMSLQKTLDTISTTTRKLNMDILLEKLGIVVDSDGLILESSNISKMQHNEVAEK
jgi:hypothetical protein